MRVLMFGAKGFERGPFTEAAAAHRAPPTSLAWEYTDVALVPATASLAAGYDGVCAFVNDRLDRECLARLKACGVRLIALRSAGYNHVDLVAAEEMGMAVARVPAYSPHAVAEHAVALIMALNRKTHRAYNRVREHNFALDGLMGFDLFGKTVGCVGTGRIGEVFCRIMLGFGCEVVAFDPSPSREVAALGVRYVPLEQVWALSDVVALHCPLTPSTRHLVGEGALKQMKPGVLLVNTSRGAVVDTRAVIDALKQGKIGGLGLDVYEEEGDLFFRDLSEEVIHDEVFARLLTFPNVLVTAHQGFFTQEAVKNIARTTVGNAAAFARGGAEGIDAACRVRAAVNVAR